MFPTPRPLNAPYTLLQTAANQSDTASQQQQQQQNTKTVFSLYLVGS